MPSIKTLVILGVVLLVIRQFGKVLGVWGKNRSLLSGMGFAVYIRQPNGSATPLEEAVIQEIMERGGSCYHVGGPQLREVLSQDGKFRGMMLPKGVHFLLLGTLVVREGKTPVFQLWRCDFRCIGRAGEVGAAGTASKEVFTGRPEILEQNVWELADGVVNYLVARRLAPVDTATDLVKS